MTLRLLALTLLALGCAELPDVERLRCGNGLIEPEANEDCDGLPAGSAWACGAPSSQHACLLICDEAPCPEGWACGADGVCRAASGRFTAPKPLSIVGDELELGHLDGDPYLDLITLTRGSLQLAFGQPGGGFAEVQTMEVPSVDLPLHVEDLDGDGDDDIILAAEQSVIVFEGDAQRSISPLIAPEEIDASYSAVRFATALRATPPYTYDEALFIEQEGRRLSFKLLDRDLNASALREMELRGQLVHHIAVGDLDGDDAEDELALGIVGGDAVYIVRFSCPAAEGRCEAQRVQSISTPEGFGLTRNGTYFGDIDGDGAPDLITSLTNGRRTIIGLSYQGPDGLGPLLEAPGLAAAAGCAGCPQPLGSFEGVQLVTDITGDGRADLITAFSVLRVEGAPPRLVEIYQMNPPLAEIGGADLNGDGRRDLYGLSAGSLTFLISDGEGALTELSAPTTAHRIYAVGDFDGDRHMDVALQHPTGELQVLFSGPRGLPSELVVMGQLEEALSVLLTARLPSPATGQVDGADDLIALTSGDVYRFFGSGARLPRTLIPLSNHPLAITVGDFTGDGPTLAVNTTPPQARGGQVDMVLGAQLTPNALKRYPLEGCDHIKANYTLSQAVEQAGEPDSLLTFDVTVPNQTPGTRTLSVRLMRFEDGAWRCTWSDELTTLMLPRWLMMFDMDQDGHRDVVSLLATSDVLGDPLAPAEARASALALWRGNGAGFDPIKLFPLPDYTLAAATLDLGGEGRRLVMAAAGQLQVARLNEAARLELIDIVEAPSGAIGMRAGDVDADGIEDLVIKTLRGASYYAQAACSARAAWEGTCARVGLE